VKPTRVESLEPIVNRLHCKSARWRFVYQRPQVTEKQLKQAIKYVKNEWKVKVSEKANFTPKGYIL